MAAPFGPNGAIHTSPEQAVGQLARYLVAHQRIAFFDLDDTMLRSRTLAEAVASVIAPAAKVPVEQFLAETRDDRFRTAETGYDLYAHCHKGYGLDADTVEALLDASDIDWLRFVDTQAVEAMQSALAAGYQVVILTTGAFAYQMAKIIRAKLGHHRAVVVDCPKGIALEAALATLERDHPEAYAALVSVVLVDDKPSHLEPLLNRAQAMAGRLVPVLVPALSQPDEIPPTPGGIRRFTMPELRDWFAEHAA